MSSTSEREHETLFEAYLASRAYLLRTSLPSMTNDEDTDPCDECTCDESHSVAKLGHCRDCEAFRPNQSTMIEHAMSNGWGCPPSHADGTPHDFDWATYSDETASYGVCRCGQDSMNHDLFILP